MNAASDTPVLAPEWGQILPKGPQIVARDGRRWTYDPQEIIGSFAALNGPLVVDYEHGQDHLAPKGQIAPAAGWIIDLEERSGSVWGRIEWTDKAAAYIVDKAYRFLSASMRLSNGNRVVALSGAGLVNRPALYVLPLDADNQPDKNNPETLAGLARQYLLEQAALGRNISITDAVMTVADSATALSALEQGQQT